MSQTHKMIRFIVRYKVYIDRARMYIGYVQFVMMTAVFLKYFHVHITILSGIIGILALVIGSIFVGWLDMKMGFFQEEAKRHSNLNPMMQEMLSKINELLKKKT